MAYSETVLRRAQARLAQAKADQMNSQLIYYKYADAVDKALPAPPKQKDYSCGHASPL